VGTECAPVPTTVLYLTPFYASILLLHRITRFRSAGFENGRGSCPGLTTLTALLLPTEASAFPVLCVYIAFASFTPGFSTGDTHMGFCICDSDGSCCLPARCLALTSCIDSRLCRLHCHCIVPSHAGAEKSRKGRWLVSLRGSHETAKSRAA
jgi:hypothetical protein